MPLVLLVLVLSVCVARADDDITFARDSLAIETADGRTFRFDIELAVTPRQRARGLMFREAMGEREGMLFLFDREAPRSFWMRNTTLALDILWLDGTGSVVGIARDAIPLDETRLLSGVPAAAVLEVLAGTAHRLEIDVGDRVIHRAFE